MLRFSVDRVFRLHCAAIVALVLVHVGFKVLFFATDHDQVLGLAPLFDLNQEASVPTFFAAAALMAAAAAAAAATVASPQRLKAGWAFATLCLAFMAVDEGVGLHDRLAIPLQQRLGTTDLLFIGWLPVYLALVAVAGAVLLPFARALPRRTAVRLVMAGAVFLGCAMGIEMVESHLMYRAAGGAALSTLDFHAFGRTPAYLVWVTVEEAGEMLGVALALRALLLHLVDELGVREICLSDALAKGIEAGQAPSRANAV